MISDFYFWKGSTSSRLSIINVGLPRLSGYQMGSIAAGYRPIARYADVDGVSASWSAGLHPSSFLLWRHL